MAEECADGVEAHTGGSGRIIDPGVGSDYFPARAGKVLTDVAFAHWDSGSLPDCNSNDCVGTGVSAFAYPESGVTSEPYCQQLGANYHPLVRPVPTPPQPLRSTACRRTIRP
jgi:hypothetical protein